MAFDAEFNYYLSLKQKRKESSMQNVNETFDTKSSYNKKAKVKIVAVTYGEPPNPSFGASTVVYFEYLNSILQRQCDLTLFILGEQELNINKKVLDLEKSLYPAKICFISTSNPLHIKKFGVLMGKSPNYFTKKIEDEDPDYLVAFDIEAAICTRKVSKTKKIIWLGDLRFQTTWYHFRLLPKNILSKFFLMISTLLRILSFIFIYKITLKSSFKTVVSSHNSIRLLRLLSIKSSYLPYPWPINLAPKFEKSFTKPKFLFFGNLVGLGSVSAFKSVYNEIYDECLKIWGEDNFEILIAGFHKMRKDFADKIRDRPNIFFLGFVPNISELLSTVNAVLVPIRVPVGNRSRVLTALGHGVPVLGHKNLRHGNPSLIDKTNCFLYDSNQELSEALKLCISDIQLVNKIINSGQNLYAKENNPKIACKKFLDVFLEH